MDDKSVNILNDLVGTPYRSSIIDSYTISPIPISTLCTF